MILNCGSSVKGGDVRATGADLIYLALLCGVLAKLPVSLGGHHLSQSLRSASGVWEVGDVVSDLSLS